MEHSIPTRLFTCTLAAGPRMMRAMATVHSRSSRGGSGAAAIAVPFFARKFWMMTSCKPLEGFQKMFKANVHHAS